MKKILNITKIILFFILFSNNILFSKLTGPQKISPKSKNIKKNPPQNRNIRTTPIKTVTVQKPIIQKQETQKTQTEIDQEEKNKIKNEASLIKLKWKSEQLNADQSTENWAKKNYAYYIEYLFLKFIISFSALPQLNLNEKTLNELIEKNIKSIKASNKNNLKEDQIKTVLTISKQELLKIEESDLLKIPSLQQQKPGFMQKIKNKFFGNDKIDELIFLLYKKYILLIEQKNPKYTDLIFFLNSFILFIETNTDLNSDDLIFLKNFSPEKQKNILKFASIRRDLSETYSEYEIKYIIANKRLLAVVLKINGINPFIEKYGDSFGIEALKNNKIFHFLKQNKGKIAAGAGTGLLLSLLGRKYNKDSVILNLANKLNPVDWVLGKKQNPQIPQEKIIGDSDYNKEGEPSKKLQEEYKKLYSSEENKQLRKDYEATRNSYNEKGASEFLTKSKIENTKENKDRYEKVMQTFNYITLINRDIPADFDFKWLYDNYDLYIKIRDGKSYEYDNESFSGDKRVETNFELFFEAAKKSKNANLLKQYFITLLNIKNIKKSIDISVDSIKTNRSEIISTATKIHHLKNSSEQTEDNIEKIKNLINNIKLYHKKISGNENEIKQLEQKIKNYEAEIGKTSEQISQYNENTKIELKKVDDILKSIGINLNSTQDQLSKNSLSQSIKPAANSTNKDDENFPWID
jgi:hypothetical protein